MITNAQNWYIVKSQNGSCQILSLAPEQKPTEQNCWGPYPSQDEAIARRVGLIRAGKCQPQ